MADRPVTELENEAIGCFLAMEMHVSDCWTCRKVEPAFQAAMGRNDMDEVRRLVPLFCAAMGRLAEEYEVALRAAFPRAGEEKP